MPSPLFGAAVRLRNASQRLSATAALTAQATCITRTTHTARSVGALLLFCLSLAAPAQALTYAEAHLLAEQSSPALQAQRAALAGAEAAQGAAAALPDPRLAVGVENLPISGPDRLSLTRDFMTMQRLALMQDVPHRAKREARSEAAQARAERERALLMLAHLQLRQALDQAWLAAQFVLARQAALTEITLENQRLQDTLPGRIAAAKASAADLVMARQEALALADRSDDLARDALKARAALRRWVGPRADEALLGAATVPVPEPAQIRAAVSRQAELAVYPALLGLAQAELREAQADSRGDWSWQVAYSRRGAQWGDMVSFQLSVDLPWQQDRRQLPTIKAKQSEAERISAEQDEALRRRVQQVDEQLAELGALDRQLARVQDSGLRFAQQRVDLAMAGYQAGQTELAAVLAGRRELLETRLRALDLEAQRDDLRVRLNHLLAE